MQTHTILLLAGVFFFAACTPKKTDDPQRRIAVIKEVSPALWADSMVYSFAWTGNKITRCLEDYHSGTFKSTSTYSLAYKDNRLDSAVEAFKGYDTLALHFKYQGSRLVRIIRQSGLHYPYIHFEYDTIRYNAQGKPSRWEIGNQSYWDFGWEGENLVSATCFENDGRQFVNKYGYQYEYGPKGGLAQVYPDLAWFMIVHRIKFHLLSADAPVTEKYLIAGALYSTSTYTYTFDADGFLQSQSSQVKYTNGASGTGVLECRYAMQ